MKFFGKKWWTALLVAALSCFLIPVIDKALPIVRDIECHRSFFPKKEFQKKLQNPPATWMLEQISQDLAPFKERKITALQVEKTFWDMYRKLGFLPEIIHFRILDNKLYKFVPENASFSYRDTLPEKALKTLLMYSKVPDCDFLFCGMDGVPEDYVPKDFYLADNEKNQAPLLAQARKESLVDKYVVLIPDQLCLSEIWHRDFQEVLASDKKISWKQKIAKAVWRGWLSDTGEPTDGRLTANYTKTPRFALCKIASEHTDQIDAGLTNLDSKELEVIAKDLGIWKAPLSKAKHLEYKYLPVLDGHMCTYPGYQWRLLSSSVCFKQESDQIQWFYNALKPYVHYIPVKNDMSDLPEKVAWAREHDDEAKAIAESATEFALNNLLLEDLYFYFHLTLSEYAKLQTIDFQELKKETKADPRWKCIQYRKRLALQKSWERFWKKLT